MIKRKNFKSDFQLGKCYVNSVDWSQIVSILNLSMVYTTFIAEISVSRIKVKASDIDANKALADSMYLKRGRNLRNVKTIIQV